MLSFCEEATGVRILAEVVKQTVNVPNSREMHVQPIRSKLITDILNFPFVCRYDPVHMRSIDGHLAPCLLTFDDEYAIMTHA